MSLSSGHKMVSLDQQMSEAEGYYHLMQEQVSDGYEVEGGGGEGGSEKGVMEWGWGWGEEE